MMGLGAWVQPCWKLVIPVQAGEGKRRAEEGVAEGGRGEGVETGRQTNGETDGGRNEKDCSRAKHMHFLMPN